MTEELRNDGTNVDLPIEEAGGGNTIVGIAYHENLNVILVGTGDGKFYVVDPTLRDVLYSTTTREHHFSLFLLFGGL